MANKAIFGSVLIIAVLSGGVFLWPNKDSDPAATDDVATGTDGAADSRSASEAELISRLARSEAEQQRLRLENRRLNTSLERAAQTDREAAPAAEPKAATSASGIDWSNLSQLIAANVEILGKFRTNSGQAEFTAAEQAQLMQIMTAFMTVNGAARERSDHPFFDSVIFDELMLALFNDSLNLTAEQAEELSRVNRAIIETALGESDLAELPPLDRFHLRREVGAEVRDALGEMLSDEQLARWEAMRVFTDSIFEGPVHTREYGLGINRLPQEITKQWQKTFRLEVHQLERARELAEEYVENARETVERYGSDEESIRALSPDDSHQLETDLAEWQRRYEQGVLSLLNAEQVEAYSQSDPTIIRFNHGTGGSSSHKSGLF